MRQLNHPIEYADKEVRVHQCSFNKATVALRIQPGAIPLTAHASAAYERGPSGSPSM